MSSDAAAAPEESGEQSDETLGSRLRTAREARELSIEKIADELRIEEHILQLLEEDRLGDIEVAPVFVKGYIKQYGRLLDLDYEELRAAYQAQADSDDVRLRPNKGIYLRDERQITIWIIAALAVILVAVALLVWWLGAEDGALLESFGDSGAAESVSVAAPITSRAEQASQAADGETPVESEPSEDSVITEQQADRAQESEATAEVPADAESASLPGDIELAVVAVSEADPLTGAPEPGSVAMLFEFSEESWFELTDVRGRRLHYDLAEPNSRLSFMVLPPAQVLIGNANAVNITVGTEVLAVPASSRRGNVASFVIDPAQD